METEISRDEEETTKVDKNTTPGLNGDQPHSLGGLASPPERAEDGVRQGAKRYCLGLQLKPHDRGDFDDSLPCFPY